MKIQKLVAYALAVAAFASCGVPSRKLSYLKDLVPDEEFTSASEPVTIIRRGDRVDINITCSNQQLSAPFNVTGSASFNEDGSVSTSTTTVEPTLRGYLVDKNGEIDFPVLGKLHLDGMSIEEVKAFIEKELVSKGYISDPVAVINIVNFRITMLGEFNNRGRKIVEGNSCNILEAIAIAGDFTTAAKLDNVLVIRSLGGNRHKTYALNMYTKDIYNSPAFNLQQNDVVYVKPRSSKPTSEFDMTTRVATLCTSIGSLLLTTFLYVWVYGIRKQ